MILSFMIFIATRGALASATRSPAEWSERVAQIEASRGLFRVNDVRIQDLNALAAESLARSLQNDPTWSQYSATLRDHLVKLQLRLGTKHAQKFVFMNIVTDLNFWSADNAAYLSAMFMNHGYGLLARPWLKLARAGDPTTLEAIRRAVKELPKKRTSFTVLLMAYELGLIEESYQIAELILAYANDVSGQDLRSMRLAYGANKIRSEDEATAYRTELNALMRQVFDELRAKQGVPRIEEALRIASGQRRRLAKYIEIVRASRNLAYWLASEVPAELYFDVASPPCDQLLK